MDIYVNLSFHKYMSEYFMYFWGAITLALIFYNFIRLYLSPRKYDDDEIADIGAMIMCLPFLSVPLSAMVYLLPLLLPISIVIFVYVKGTHLITKKISQLNPKTKTTKNPL